MGSYLIIIEDLEEKLRESKNECEELTYQVATLRQFLNEFVDFLEGRGEPISKETLEEYKEWT